MNVCVSQDGERFDALRLARELSSRKLESGAPLAMVAITRKAPSPRVEQELVGPGAPFVRTLLTEQSVEARSAAIERLGCNYNIQVWYHEGYDSFDANAPAAAARPQPNGEQTVIEYQLRKAGGKELLARATLPQRTVFIRQGRRMFDPYPIFANQIVKKLNGVH